jgi:hypothetical protein
MAQMNPASSRATATQTLLICRLRARALGKARRQSQLCLPSLSANGLAQTLLAALRPVAHACSEAIVPRRFRQQAARMRIAGLGDRTPADALATGGFGRHQAQIAHQLARMREPTDVADLGDQPNSRNFVDAAQGLQRSHDRLEAPARDRLAQCCRQPLNTRVGAADRLAVFGEGDLIAGIGKRQRRQRACACVQVVLPPYATLARNRNAFS